MSRSKQALVFLALALMLICAWTPWAQASAERHAEDGLTRALATYAAARAINALISVAQSTQVSVQPAGIGIATHPGEVLDPVNDLIEQFSSLLLAASVAFGIQLLLIKAGAHDLVSVLLTCVAIAWCVVYVSRATVPRWLTKALALLMLIRFAVPVAVIASEQTYQALFQSQYQESVTVLKNAPSSDRSATRADTRANEDRAPRSSWEDWLPSFKKAPAEEKQAADSVDGVVARMQAFLKDGVKHVVTLAALFVVQTVVLPFLFLWSLLTALRYAGLRLPSRLPSAVS
jgi:hypothetical protein